MSHDNPDTRTQWQVLNMPTGTGKTQCVSVYASMLATYTQVQHPGLLIVKRLKQEADKLAEDINRQCNSNEYAFSYNSDNSGSVNKENLCKYPVLVITHRAYQLALMLDCERQNQDASERFHSWQGYGRHIIVIDEAFDVVNVSQLSLNSLRQTVGAVSQAVREMFPDETQLMLKIITRFESIAADKTTHEQILNAADFCVDVFPDLTFLRLSLRKALADAEHPKQSCAVHDDVLRRLQHIMSGWIYYARLPKVEDTLNTASLIVPKYAKGAIVLDATASNNLTYTMFKKASVIHAPANVRSYASVTLHVNRGQDLGKVVMRQKAATVLPPLFDDLNQRLVGRSALFVTHKQTKADVYASKADFNLSVGHWGALDGSNEWQDCDTVVIFGLPTMPSAWAVCRYAALHGGVDTDWLASSHRPYGDHKDIRSALRNGQTDIQIIQAINRIRCRKVVDSKGNCLPCDIFILLPSGDQGDKRIETIKKAMPGIVVKDWIIEGLGTKAKTQGLQHKGSKAKTSILNYLANVPVGSYSASLLQKDIKISQSTFSRFQRSLDDIHSETSKTLLALNVVFHRGGFGRGSECVYEKRE